MKKPKEILITGGAGAIGSVLVRQLLPDHQITIVDNLSSGQRANVESLDVDLVVADIRDHDKLASIFAKKSFDIVIHLAAHFANQNSVDFPATDLSVNVAGTVNLLELCRESRPRFVYASSSCVYGGKVGPLHETLPIDDLHTPYAITKYTGELYSRFYAHHYGIESVALRFFNNYGPFDPPGRYRNAVPNFILKAIRGDDIVITGTGEETRDFCFCENTADAIRLAAMGGRSTIKPFDVLNTGTGIETRIIDVVKRITELTRSKSRVQILGKRRDWDHSVRRCADITAARERLGYTPKIMLSEGLEKTVGWMTEREWKL